MKRLTPLLLALGALATGCYSNDNQPGTVTFYWNFQNAQGTVAGNFTPSQTGCDVAAVDTVRITIDNTTVDQPCVGSNGVPGVTLLDFARGSYDFSMEGFRSGEVVFTSSGTVNADWNADSPNDVTLTAVSPQSFVIYYDVNSATPTQCAVGGVPVVGVAYEIDDLAGNVVATTAGAGGVQYPAACDPSSFGVSVPGLPLASYTVRYFSLLNSAGQSLAQTCAAPVQHDGFPILLDLIPATTACQ